MKKFLYSISLFVGFSCYAVQAETPSTKATCQQLGYTDNAQDCVNQKSSPLLCPFATNNDMQSVCLNRSCRGYPLFKENGKYYYMGEGGNKILAQPSIGKLEDYIEGEMESCASGAGENAVVYYRIARCKSGALYQNNICDVGCDTVNKYPFETHPGSLAGTVERCVNENGEYFGYVACNDGWMLSKGRCLLNDCNIATYPYSYNPNSIYNRGAVLTCKIGGNSYYKYADISSEEALPPEGSCQKNGYELNGGVCSNICEIDVAHCTKQTISGYNKWKCPLTTTKDRCDVGDFAAINGQKLGIIVHIPDETDDRTLIVAPKVYSGKWIQGDNNDAVDIPALPNRKNGIDDTYNGKINTLTIMDYKAQNPAKIFPIIETSYEYTTSACQGNEFCQYGQWFVPCFDELMYVFNSRYLIYNIMGPYSLGTFFSSSETSIDDIYSIDFATSNTRVRAKWEILYSIPMLAF